VRIAADDDLGRERLVRYCTRPPFALDRIEVLSDGRIAYLLKVPRKGRTHRIMTSMEFMARLSAQIPRPRIPLVRYHGVFAPRSSWRSRVTPKPPAHAAKPKPCAATPAASASTSTAVSPASASLVAASSAAAAPAPAAAVSPAPASLASASCSAAAALAPALTLAVATPEVTVAWVPEEPVVDVDPTMISVSHWGRLEEGALFAWSRRLEWPVMMKRTFGFDVLRCPRCSRKMRVIATITEPPVVHQILEHLGVRASPLPRAPARDPDWEQTDLGFDADAYAA
jgi:hypothetical protein